jgi:hypothetical protein
MRRTTVGFAILIALGSLATATAEAQDFRGIVGAGISVPMGAFGDEDDGAAKAGGLHGLVGAEWVPAGSFFGLRLDGAYQLFCTTACEDAEGDLDIKYRIMHAGLTGIGELKADTPGHFRPYVLVGIGMYNWKLQGDDVPVGFDESETDFGANAGLGVNVGFGAASVFLEARFHNVFLEDEDLQYIPITLGVRFGG